MGIFWDSSEEKKETDNTGLLNGNFINNGNIVKSIDREVNTIEKLFISVIFLLFLILVVQIGKSVVKYIKKSAEQERRIETIALQNPRI